VAARGPGAGVEGPPAGRAGLGRPRALRHGAAAARGHGGAPGPAPCPPLSPQWFQAQIGPYLCLIEFFMTLMFVYRKCIEVIHNACFNGSM
jgi:hypothetical protein